MNMEVGQALRVAGPVQLRSTGTRQVTISPNIEVINLQTAPEIAIRQQDEQGVANVGKPYVREPIDPNAGAHYVFNKGTQVPATITGPVRVPVTTGSLAGNNVDTQA